MSSSRWVLLPVIAMVLAVVPTVPAAAIQSSGFELDGNAVASTGEDWSTLFPTNHSTTVYNESFIHEPSSSDTTYFTVASKDVNDVSTWNDGGPSAPDKDEINDAFAAAYKGGDNSTRLYFGMDRYANNGDSTVGFWFLQEPIIAGAPFQGHHARNDILIVSDFTNGGRISNITVYKWDANATNGPLVWVASGQDCSLGTTTTNLCAIVNGATVTSPWSYTPKQGASGSFPAGSFFEGGINLTALFPSAAPCFTNFLAETRSSQSTTATLKDFALHAFNNCPIVPPESAFDLLKTADASPINLGQTLGFNITLANGGPDDSFNTNLSDPLPPIAGGWTLNGVWALPSLNVTSGCVITGTAPTQTLTCAFGSLAVFEGRAIHISAATAATGDCGVQTNTAFLTTNDNASQSQQSTATAYVTCSDVGVLKTASPPVVAPRTPIGFYVNVTAHGPDPSQNVHLNDTLPLLTFPWSLSGADAASCSLVDRNLTCDFGTLNASATRSIFLSADTIRADCALVPNTATVTSTFDINASNDHSTASALIDCSVPPLSAIVVDKVARAPVVDIGSDVVFDITVSNSGPDPAENTTIWDQLPPVSGGWSLSGADSAACGIDVTGNLTCNFGTVAVFGTRSITVTAHTGALTDCGLLTNVVFLTANGGLDNDRSQDSTYVTCADVGVVKTAGPSPVSLGANVTYTIQVTANGPDPSESVTLTDTLPAVSGTWVVGGADAASCGIAAGVLSCSFGTMTMGEQRNLTLTASTSVAADAGNWTNTAFVTARLDTDPGNNQSSATVLVLLPSLGILKTADATPVNAGDSMGFTITVSNGGPGTAFGVTLTDPLPSGSGISWSTSSAGCSITTGTLSCSFGDLASGASASAHVGSGTTFASAGTYPNTATANATNNPPVSANATIVVLAPSLGILKTADATPVNTGDSIGFAITVSNGGPGTAYGVTLTDPLPSGSGISWSTSSAGCSITTGTLSCSFGDLASGASASAHVTSGTTAASAGTYPNTATASATNHADVTANATIVVLAPSLGITKTADATPVNAGDTIGFTINVTNGGPGIARSVTLHDPLPTGTGVSWSTATAGCSITSQVLDCSIGDLASGAFFVAHVTSGTTFASAGTYPNIAVASSTNNEPTNVTANDTIVVLAPSLGLTKTADAASVSAGSPIGFVLTVTNGGPGVAYGVTITDALPTGSGVSWIDDSFDCSIASSTLTCSFGDLGSGISATVHVTSPTTLASCQAYPNSASANATNHPVVTANATTTVLCPALTLVKLADAGSVSAGSPIGFGLWLNNTGAGVETSVTLSDPLPSGAGLAWSIDVDATGLCGIATGTLTCSYGDLASGAARFVHVTSPTTFASCGEYNNTATARNLETVNATATTAVLCPSLSLNKTADAASVSAGASIGFTLTVTNAGPGVARGVTLTDPLPVGGGVSWSTASAGCSVTADVLSCSFGDLASGASASAHVTSLTDLSSCQAYPNTATASATNHASVTGSATTTVLCPAMTIVKHADAASVSAGDSIGFGIWVNNTGNGTETSVTLSDPLPSGAGVSWSIDVDATGLCGIATGTLTCSYGDLAPGAARYVHVTSPTTFASCGEYPNTATAHNQETVTASATTTVLCPSLSLQKTADAASVTAGSPIGFTLTVSNGGPGAADAVTLTDALPTGTNISWTDDSAACDITTGTLSCSFGDLASGASATVHVTSPTDVSSCATYPNTATASATNHANVTASASTTVNCPMNATRTLGFWQTHTAYTEHVFDANFSDVMPIGTGGHVRTIDTYGKLFGAFYSSIPYKSDGVTKRSQIDKARVTLLQQLVAAKLNCAAFGCSASNMTTIASADAAYAGTDKALMGYYTAQLDAYNNWGDAVPIGPTGSATPALSQAIADRAYWDNP